MVLFAAVTEAIRPRVRPLYPVSMRDLLVFLLGSVCGIVFIKLAYDWLERRERKTERGGKDS